MPPFARPKLRRRAIAKTAKSLEGYQADRPPDRQPHYSPMDSLPAHSIPATPPTIYSPRPSNNLQSLSKTNQQSPQANRVESDHSLTPDANRNRGTSKREAAARF